MAANFCLPKHIAKDFLEAIRTGRVSITDLASIPVSADRRAALAKIVGEDMAEPVNALLESKLLLKNQKRGLDTFVRQITTDKQVRRDMLDKIGKLDRILEPPEERAFLADLAKQKLGVEVTAEQGRRAMELTRDALDKRAQPTTSPLGVSDDYLKAAATARQYIESLAPKSRLASLGKNLLLIARNNLLMNPATPIKTTIGQVVNSTMDLFTRRIGQQAAAGTNGALKSAFKSANWATYRETGLNGAAMESLDDMGRLGEGRRFEVTQGPGAKESAIEKGVRKTAEVSNKIVIDWAHVAPFVKFYQHAFFDSADLLATHLAEGDAAKSEAIFRDAAKIRPETPEGTFVRAEAQKQAARVTSTNDTVISKVALRMKDGINSAVPGLGDLLMPIAKIPANIVWNGIENAGVGLPLGARDIFRGLADMKSADPAVRLAGQGRMAFGIQRLARTTGVLGAAAFFASQMTPADFMTDRNGNNFVRMAGVWVNMEYVAAISPALAGMMEAKRYGAGSYVAGVASSLKHAPGVDEIPSAVAAVSNPNLIKGIGKYLQAFFYDRAVPAFARQVVSGQGNPTDTARRLAFGSTGVRTDADVYGRHAEAVERTVNSPGWQRHTTEWQANFLDRIRKNADKERIKAAQHR